MGSRPPTDTGKLSARPNAESIPTTSQIATADVEPSGHETVHHERDMPRQIGRYTVLRQIGKGAFGEVFLGYDCDLERKVAIKIPLASKLFDAHQFLDEARLLAKLEHPHIVPVFDFGRIGSSLCYVVSKYVEGKNLEQLVSSDQINTSMTCSIVARIAEALHFAHQSGVIHRDVKPANILIGSTGTPYLADFGLAVRETELDRSAAWVGTPIYMSPEQARGEGHRVDGRSDIFSLGAVLYELLTGSRPFQGDSSAAVMEKICRADPVPPRQLRDSIPTKLEAICCKALEKRAERRFFTAGEMATQLNNWQQAPAGSTEVHKGQTLCAPTVLTRTKLRPKGLRAFEAEEASSFLSLLPGPIDDQGLPCSVEFWLRKIEQRDSDKTFKVGLLYGPSGSGKTSFLRAGLLPLLSDGIETIYLEASERTSQVMLERLTAFLPANAEVDIGSLPSVLGYIRRTNVLNGKKLLVVIDQFEQWLHVNHDFCHELVDGLRHCDGCRVQAIVSVRDDFWMAATRFMQALEIRLLEDINSAAIDLFDLAHARRVLTDYGRALGKLPEDAAELSAEQNTFISHAIDDLEEGGRVICVRIALFAEMMKDRNWTQTELTAIGGASTVGELFLEAAFELPSSPPAQKYHQKAARNVLGCLLPPPTSNIKGAMQARKTLLEASGYRNRPQDFDALIQILDEQLRLITPTTPEGSMDENTAGLREESPSSQGRHFQLTHDYFVPPLRDWLVRKRKETFRGRTEILLEDRAAMWGARSENRLLPSVFEYARFSFFTNRKKWTPQQRLLIKKAEGVYNRILLLSAIAFISVAIASQYALNSYLHVMRENSRLLPERGRVLASNPLYRAEESSRAGDFYLERGDAAKAVANYEESISLYETMHESGNIEARSRLWKYYRRVAAIYSDASNIELRNPEKAVQHLTRACELSGWAVSNLIAELAAAHAQLGNFEDAIQLQKRAIQRCKESDIRAIREAELRIFEQDASSQSDKLQTDKMTADKMTADSL